MKKIIILTSLLITLLIIPALILNGKKIKTDNITIINDNSTNKSNNQNTNNNTSQNNKQNTEDNNDSKKQETYKAPDIYFSDINDNKIFLSSKFDKPIFINFFASWCGPCKSEMPMLNEIYNEYKNDINFVFINLTTGRETKETALKYINDNNFDFEIYFDYDSSAAITYQAFSIPTTWLIDKDNNLFANASGILEEDPLREALNKLIEN